MLQVPQPGVEKYFYPTGTGSGKAWLRLQQGVSGSGSVKRNFQCIIVNKKVYAPLLLFKKGQFGHENHIYLQKVLGKKVLVFFYNQPIGRVTLPFKVIPYEQNKKC